MSADPLIDAELAAFMQGGVSIHVASRDAECVPQLARALGCRVSGDRRRVTVLLPASQSGALLADLGATGAIAVVFSLPTTHRTVQLKGADAAVEAIAAGDMILVGKYRDAFLDQLTAMGFDPGIPRTLLGAARGDLVAVGFTPTSAFVQTPGPGAGAALKGP